MLLKIFTILIIFLALFAWEALKILRKREIKEFIVFSFLALIGLALSIFAVIQSFN